MVANVKGTFLVCLDFDKNELDIRHGVLQLVQQSQDLANESVDEGISRVCGALDHLQTLDVVDKDRHFVDVGLDFNFTSIHRLQHHQDSI